MIAQPNTANPRFFAVTSPGLSASRWLSFVLASHPKVYVAHGKHRLDAVIAGDYSWERQFAGRDSLESGNDLRDFYETQSVEAVLSQYREVKPDAVAFGCVHSYTIESLIRSVESPSTLASLKVWNLLRHPANYIASHEALVRSAEFHPRLYKLYTDDVFPQALASFPELRLMNCPDLKAFFTFVVSCFGVANQIADLAFYPGFQHVKMEAVTTSIELLQRVCEDVTGLSYSRKQLEEFIQGGSINSHRSAGATKDPAGIVDSWETWKRDIAAVMISETVLTRFEENGYDVSMLRPPLISIANAEPKTMRASSCLGDRLRAIAPEHPWLTNLNHVGCSPIQEIETKYQGFRMTERNGRFYAVASVKVESDLGALSLRDLGALEEDDFCLSAESWAELLLLIRQHINVSSSLSGGPRLLLEGYAGFNLVSFSGQVYALSQALGGLDLTQMASDKLKQLVETGQVFVFASLKEAKQRLDRLVVIQTPPRLMEEGYRGFNFVAFSGNVYAISQDLGPFDLTRAGADEMQTIKKIGKVIVCPSILEAKIRVDELRGQRVFS